VTVHAQALNLINDSGIIVVLLCARLGDLSAHILEQILRKTLLFGHIGILVFLSCGVVVIQLLNLWLSE
jgi:small neutral amino acid transporter SnatA (MarC family)